MCVPALNPYISQTWAGPKTLLYMGTGGGRDPLCPHPWLPKVGKVLNFRWSYNPIEVKNNFVKVFVNSWDFYSIGIPTVLFLDSLYTK